MLENLAAIEKRVYSAYWDDGLLDLLAAVGVLAIGIFWMLDRPVAAAVVPAVLVPFWSPLRQRFIEPRLGMVEFTDARERRTRRLLLQVMLFGAGVFVLGVSLYYFRDRLDIVPAGTLIAGLPALLLALLALITASLIATPRFVGYAAALFVAGVGGALLGWEPGVIMATAGTAMLAFAVSVLLRFLRDSRTARGELQ